MVSYFKVPYFFIINGYMWCHFFGALSCYSLIVPHAYLALWPFVGATSGPPHAWIKPGVLILGAIATIRGAPRRGLVRHAFLVHFYRQVHHVFTSYKYRHSLMEFSGLHTHYALLTCGGYATSLFHYKTHGIALVHQS